MKTKQSKGNVRQGDVLILYIDSLPANIVKQAPIDGRIILAYGEVTGHHHTIDADAADWWKDDKGNQFVDIATPTEIVHQEHSPIPMKKGVARIIIQRERSLAQTIRVRD